jgi:DNA primase
MAAGLVKESSRGAYDVFRNRLMFPIADANGRLLGFGGRTLGEDPAKYLNTPGTLLFDKSTSLFGLDRARDAMAKAGRAIVVEGYTDCIMAHQHGFAETVATLGTAMTDAHANVLRRQTDRVVLVFDSDQAGERAADRALSVSLLGGLDVTLARVPHGKDPCDYLLSAGREGFSLVLNAALPALEFKWHLVVREYDASATGPGRRRAIEAYLLQLSEWLGQGVVDPIQTGLLVNQLSKILALPSEEVHRALHRHLKRSTKAGARPAAPAPPRPPAAGAEQEALKQIIEVLLNDPEQYPAVAAVFDPTAINDAALSAVAREMVTMITSGDAFQLDELIGRFELPSFARLITDLQTRGERRGGYSAVVEGAVLCFQSTRQTRETAVLAGEIRTHRQHAQDPIPPGEDERLLALAASARKPHFSTPKARRRFLGL